MTTAERFEADMTGDYPEQKRLGYNPTDWMMMVARHGAVGAAKRVLRPGPPPSGFVRLAWELNRPDLTVEHYALRPEYQELFTSDELAIARERLGMR